MRQIFRMTGKMRHKSLVRSASCHNRFLLDRRIDTVALFKAIDHAFDDDGLRAQHEPESATSNQRVPSAPRFIDQLEQIGKRNILRFFRHRPEDCQCVIIDLRHADKSRIPNRRCQLTHGSTSFGSMCWPLRIISKCKWDPVVMGPAPCVPGAPPESPIIWPP